MRERSSCCCCLGTLTQKESEKIFSRKQFIMERIDNLQDFLKNDDFANDSFSSNKFEGKKNYG